MVNVSSVIDGVVIFPLSWKLKRRGNTVVMQAMLCKICHSSYNDSDKLYSYCFC